MPISRDLEFVTFKIADRQLVMQGVPGADDGRAVERYRDLTRVNEVRELPRRILAQLLAVGRIGKKPDHKLDIVSELAA
jgi:hypothetical protein